MIVAGDARMLHLWSLLAARVVVVKGLMNTAPCPIGRSRVPVTPSELQGRREAQFHEEFIGYLVCVSRWEPRPCE